MLNIIVVDVDDVDRSVVESLKDKELTIEQISEVLKCPYTLYSVDEFVIAFNDEIIPDALTWIGSVNVKSN